MAVEIEKKKREFFPETFTGEDAGELRGILEDMLGSLIESPSQLERLIEKYGELGDILEEVGAWKTIRMSQYANDPELAKAQAEYYETVIAPVQPLFAELDRKIAQSPLFASLPQERYAQLWKLLKNEIELYREENVPLFVKENSLVSKYAELYAQVTMEFEGKERTIQEMELFFKDKDRGKREAAWRLIAQKLAERKGEFEELFDSLKDLRVRIAANAGFGNYRDYMHRALGRFDYSPADLLEFHDAIREVAMPATEKINAARKDELGVDTLRPWDMYVDLDGSTLRPFEDTKDLLEGCIRILGRVDQQFSDVLSAMARKDLLDLGNRKGKAPGGFSYPLEETGASFIFMNAVGVQRDVQTLLHESGHSMHAYAVRDEKIGAYKNPPSEINELASMSMELMTMDYFSEFYKDDKDLMKARREQLEDVILVFSKVAAVDAFQHWIYLQDECSAHDREAKYAELKDLYNGGVDWAGLEALKGNTWIRVMHVFEVPFYYVEYAIAQLGAIAIYKNYKEDPLSAIEKYKDFMQLGYSKSVSEIYAAAGIKFDFSKEYLKELIDFVMEEIGKCGR